MRLSSLVLIAALSASLGLSRVASAQAPAAASGPPPLSAAQKEAMAKVKSETEKKAAPLAARVAATAKRVYENMLSEKPDEALRQKLSREFNEAIAGVLAAKGQSFWDAVKVLTPEQKQAVRRELAKPDVPGDLGEVIDRLFGLSDK